MGIRQKTKGVVYAVLSAIALGVLPIFATLAYKGGTNSITVAFYRFLFSTIILFIYFLIKKISFKINREIIPSMVFASLVGYAATALTLFSSFTYISPGLATILHFIYPALVIFLSFILFKESLSTIKVVSLILSIVGIYILVGFGNVKNNFTGIMLALASGVFYSIYILSIAHSKIKNIESLLLTFYVSLFSSIGIFVFGIITRTISFKIQFISLIPIVLIALSSIYGLVAFAIAVKLIGSSNTSILSTFEPITSIVLSAIIFKEKITINIILGTILIVMSIYGIIKEQLKENKENSISEHSNVM
ncbi:DMT family transporter [Alkaliphilus sp. B6464]|uniref:DMT family transporter n=1 Tax=Alkaliphilus sp. B6464 TaxID=2731219 RepID=UPI001BA7F9DE|nr:DMT family transporter [Alkaliphilus sp. B6464]QUH21472.1 DMT family transporter [Alkaliphilus sp. B6464]